MKPPPSNPTKVESIRRVYINLFVTLIYIYLPPDTRETRRNANKRPPPSGRKVGWDVSRKRPSVRHSEGLGCPAPVCAVMEPYFFKEYVLAVQLLHFIGIVEFFNQNFKIVTWSNGRYPIFLLFPSVLNTLVLELGVVANISTPCCVRVIIVT